MKINNHSARERFSRAIRPLCDTWHMEIDTESACWIWPGELYTDTGYGRVEHEDGRTQGAHRFVYERLVGPIPSGKQLHHECREKACVNPAHLRPVTTREHGKAHRLTHCKNGHPLEGANLLIEPDGHRRCLPCSIANGRLAGGGRRKRRSKATR